MTLLQEGSLLVIVVGVEIGGSSWASSSFPEVISNEVYASVPIPSLHEASQLMIGVGVVIGDSSWASTRFSEVISTFVSTSSLHKGSLLMVIGVGVVIFDGSCCFCCTTLLSFLLFSESISTTAVSVLVANSSFISSPSSLFWTLIVEIILFAVLFEFGLFVGLLLFYQESRCRCWIFGERVHVVVLGGGFKSTKYVL